FVFLNIHALLARFLKLFEYLLRFIDAAWVPLQFHPSLTGGYFHTEGVLKGLQKFNVTGVERLQSAWALKLQSPRFSHQCGKLSVRIINMNGDLCAIDFRSQPEPIFVSFKQLLPHCFFFSRTKIASPVILTHLKSLLHVRFCSLERK